MYGQMMQNVLHGFVYQIPQPNASTCLVKEIQLQMYYSVHYPCHCRMLQQFADERFAEKLHSVFHSLTII